MDLDTLAAAQRRRNIVVVAFVIELLAIEREGRPAGIRTTYTNATQGEQLTTSLLGNDDRLYRFTRFKLVAFEYLLDLISPHLPARVYRNAMSKDQKLVIFLHACAKNAHTRDLAEPFSHSPETIGRVFHDVLEAILKVYPAVVKPAKESDRLKVRPLKKGRFWPWFERCVGALDSSHIDAHVALNEQAAYRNRKGTLTQNVLAVVDFDMRFTFILAGWEGSAHNGRVLTNARAQQGFAAPEGCYYLGDAGYSNNEITLTPYRGVRYHLREQYSVKLKPQNPKELFNLRHSSLRNVIERSFGVMKRRFRILERAPWYSMSH